MTVTPITLNQAADQIEAHLKRWLPDFLGYAAAQEGVPRSIAGRMLPQRYGRIDDWPSNGQTLGDLPALFIIAAGRAGAATVDDGIRSERAAMQIAILTPGPGEGGTDNGSGHGVRLYDFALLNLWLQKPWVSEVARATDVGEVVFSQPIATVGMGVQTLMFEVATASTEPFLLTDPTEGEPPRDPDEWVEVESVDVAVEAIT